MALKIKEGSSIDAYGANSIPFTSETPVSQAVLEHLQTRFPNDIEEVKADKAADKAADKK